MKQRFRLYRRKNGGRFYLRDATTGKQKSLGTTDRSEGRLHNFALDMNWLPWPIVPRKRWPQINLREKRAITFEEHRKILAGESNAELRDYYELLWQVGGSQTDIASLRGGDID